VAQLTKQRHPTTDAGGDAPVLAANGLCLGYGGMRVVHDLNLEVRRGEVVALLGANGAGKSTTLLGLCGYLKPQAGFVTVDEQRTTAPLHLRARQGLAFVPESRSVFSQLSVADNLRLGRVETSAALAHFPELEPLLGKRGGLLSGGEQQMLTMARALCREPKVLLVDELSLGLAPQIVTRLLGAVRKAADDGVGVLIVEQYVRGALEVADRAYVLHRGHVAIKGTADELLARLDEIEGAYLATSSSAQPEDPEGRN
jgi:branched-chain amino acid transport system ATP-binding protein